MADKRRMAGNSRTAGKRTAAVCAGRRFAVVAAMIMTAILFTACRGGGPVFKTAAAQAPGTLENGTYMGGDGRFTVEADEARWQISDSEDSWELSLLENRSVHISFSPTEGLTEDMIKDFQTSFADGYVETLKEEYPDIQKKDIREVSAELAGLGMTMTDPGSGSGMYQFLYLASDGENGYLITSAFPIEQETALKQEVMQVIESIRFIEKEQT